MVRIFYGYKVEDGKVTPDPDSSLKVKKLYDEFINGTSMLESARRAQIDKTHSGIRNILMNKAYLGNTDYPRIINDVSFNKAQTIRIENARKLGKAIGFQNKTRKPLPDKFELNDYSLLFIDAAKQAAYVYSQIKEKDNE